MAEVAAKEKVVKAPKEALFSKKNRKLIIDPITDNNPITIQVLGICSALAITAQLQASIVMAISVIFVLGLGNVVISLMRNIIPPKIRIIVQLIVVATLVIIVDLVLKTFAYELSKTLSVFVGLIITNCIIMGRFEAFALANNPWKSFLDGMSYWGLELFWDFKYWEIRLKKPDYMLLGMKITDLCYYRQWH
jgi:Na+-transporting NADH:ubiquinone oxidoreductase subunit D